jgi:tetratricopeptide (TPR) repeat protein
MRPTLELSMIVKNGGRPLERCLASVRDAVDRIVIGDTGSTDETAEIAARFDAEVIGIPWEGNFAAARNLVLRQASCDWVLVLDADEMLDPDGARSLRPLLATTDRCAFNVMVWNYVKQWNSRSGTDGPVANPGTLTAADAYPAYIASVNTRLFRRHPGVYFERPVHETVVHRVQELGLSLGKASFVIHHLGFVEAAEAARSAKEELYLEIGRDHLAAFPEDTRTAYELGWGALEHAKDPQAGLELLLRAIELDQSNTEAIVLAGVCLLRLGRHAEAVRLFTYAVQRKHPSIVLYDSLGDAHLHLRQYQAAADAYGIARGLGGGSPLLLAKFGACQVYLQNTVEGMTALRDALGMDPDQAELIDIVIAGAVQAGELSFAASLADRRLQSGGATELHHTIAAFAPAGQHQSGIDLHPACP